MKIYTFKPDMYPFTMWVIVRPDEKEISKLFSNKADGEPYKYVSCDDWIAMVTRPIRSNKTKAYGCAIILEQCPEVSTIAHESCHFADAVYDYIGETTINFGSEVNAYFVGWIAGKIDEVVKEEF